MKMNMLLKSAALATGACLLLAIGGPAEAADLLAIDKPTVDASADCSGAVPTAKILKMDTATGMSVVVADTEFTRCTGAFSVNTDSGPNGLAYAAGSGTAYWATVPSAGPGSLYAKVVDPGPAGALMSLGVLFGVPHGATFYAGKYWYIHNGTLGLRAVSFGAGGMISSDDPVCTLPVLNPGATGLGFGDLSADEDGFLFGSAFVFGAATQGGTGDLPVLIL